MRLNLRTGLVALVFALFFTAVGAGVAMAVQTHMVNARADLQSALTELNAASSDKAGHRVNAMNLVNRAINQVNLGINAGAQ